MRVALMAWDEESGTRVRLAGRPIAWHQMHSLLAIGCERIVCLAAAPGAGLAGLQREAEARGARFHAVSQHRALSGLVSGGDTLFVLAPGIVTDREWLAGALGGRVGIAVLDADGAIDRGFERIDRERAWGGVLAIRGDAVEALAGLPADADPIASLLRIALQRSSRTVAVPDGWLDDGRWALVTTVSEAARLERGWRARHVPAPAFDRPGEALAHRLAAALLPRVADRRALAPGLVAAGMAAALAGGTAGYLGHTLAGMIALAAGAMTALVGERLGTFARAGSAGKPRDRLVHVREGLLDLALVAVAASPQAFASWLVPYAAMVLVAAVRLARETDAPRPMRPLGDRTLVFGVLVLAAAAGVFVPALGLIGLIGFGVRLFWPSARG